MKAVVWDDEALGAKYHDEEIPADLKDKAAEYRTKMIEAAVDLDDEAMAAYLDGKEPDEATLKRLIRKAVVTGAIRSGAVRLGVQEQGRAAAARRRRRLSADARSIVPAIKGLDMKAGGRAQAVRHRAASRPSPSRSWTIRSSAPSPSAASIRARLQSGTGVINSTKDRKERIGRMLLMHANNREDIKEAFAGDIVALAGLKEVRTGDTLCDPQKPVILEKMEFPDPVIEIAIEPKSKADQEKLGVALAKLAAEDPSFRVSTDQESGQTILKGMGELHLDIKVDILQAHLQGGSQYRRAAGRLSREDHRKVEVDYTHKKQTGGTGQFARVKIVVEPNEPGKGFEFESKVVGGTVPKEYIPGVEKGLESVLGSGVLAGFPVVDLKVTLIDGAYHEVDSSALAFEIAARAALREALRRRPARCCSSRS